MQEKQTILIEIIQDVTPNENPENNKLITGFLNQTDRYISVNGKPVYKDTIVPPITDRTPIRDLINWLNLNPNVVQTNYEDNGSSLSQRETS